MVKINVTFSASSPAFLNPASIIFIIKCTTPYVKVTRDFILRSEIVQKN
jgi:hypothetical protein